MKKWITYLLALSLSCTPSLLATEISTNLTNTNETKIPSTNTTTTENPTNTQITENVTKLNETESNSTTGTENATNSAISENSTDSLNTKNETIYVNLDHVGSPTAIQVVNSYQLYEGATSIIDYGTYKEITNLTDYTTPQVKGDKIIWKLNPNTKNAFYYQGTLDTLELPWTFNMRYYLNGKPVKAEDLIGASGLVETFIDCTPNDNVSDYLKNNFFLQLTASYDIGKCLSIEAPDGVIVSLGATQSITFMAMPGEETSFSIRVGANCYESSGFNIVIAPLRMSALDEVKKITDVKNRVEDAFDAASDSLDVILDSTDNIKESVDKLTQSLSTFKTSLNTIRGEDAKTDANLNHLINESRALSQDINKLVPHFNEIDKLLKSLTATGNTSIKDIEGLRPYLQSTRDTISLLNTDFTELTHFINALNQDNLNTQETLADLRQKLEKLKGDMLQLDTSLDSLSQNLNNTQSSLEHASKSLADFSINIDKIDMLSFISTPSLAYMDRFSQEDLLLLQLLQSKVNDTVSHINRDIYDGTDYINDKIGSINEQIQSVNKNIETINDAANDGSDEASDVLLDTSKLLGSTSGVVGVLRGTSVDLAMLSASLDKSIIAIEAILKTLDMHNETLLFTIDDFNTLLFTLGQASTIADLLLDDLIAVQDVINRLSDEISGLLKTVSQTTLHTSSTINAATELGSGLLNSITSNRQHLYNSVDNLIDGISNTTQSISYSLGTTNTLKTNKNTIQTTIEDEWNRLDDDFNLLNYDPDAIPVSLVSDKNTSVNSVQIILRTPELTIDKDDDYIFQELATPELTVVDRIKNIFNSLFAFVVPTNIK